VREIMSSYSWVKGEPYRPGEVAVEKEVGVILNCSTKVAGSGNLKLASSSKGLNSDTNELRNLGKGPLDNSN
jgi:hypothetical protein